MFCILVDNFRHLFFFLYVFLLYSILIINKEILIILSTLSIVDELSGSWFSGLAALTSHYTCTCTRRSLARVCTVYEYEYELHVYNLRAMSVQYNGE